MGETWERRTDSAREWKGQHGRVGEMEGGNGWVRMEFERGVGTEEDRREKRSIKCIHTYVLSAGESECISQLNA